MARSLNDISYEPEKYKQKNGDVAGDGNGMRRRGVGLALACMHDWHLVVTQRTRMCSILVCNSASSSA